MILHLPPGSSALAIGAAEFVLVVHIGAASLGLLSGAAALAFRKGQRLHLVAGNVFFVSMLTMSAIGAAVAAIFPARISAVAGVLTFYLTATAWVTVRRRDQGVGLFDIGALLAAVGAAVADVSFGLQASSSPTGLLDGLPWQPAFVFASVAALAAALDLKVILARGVFGAQRIARHLWRMCIALLIATTSFFQGQDQVFPTALRGSPILLIPSMAVFGLMIFWLLRVCLPAGPKAGAPARMFWPASPPALVNLSPHKE